MADFVTFARNVFIPVTNVCRNRCGYCGFRKEPDDPQSHLMSPEEIIPILEKGKELGCSEALFTFGEQPEEVEGYSELLQELGYSSNIDYIADLCRIAIETGLLPHTNAGIVTHSGMKQLAEFNASMGLMLETTATVKAHSSSPGKLPEKRFEFIKNAGELKVPFTTGILVGIGESREDRIHSLETISKLHEKYGHIQEVIIQNFTPKPGTEMENLSAPDIETMIDTVSMARSILQDDVAVQVPPNLTDPRLLIRAGASDLGGISPATIDWINPESSWPSVDKLQQMVGSIPLRERLPIYPQYIEKGWYSDTIAELIGFLSCNGYRKDQSIK